MSLKSVLARIESVKDYKVLFVGDYIIDEYHYVVPLGKSPKEHLIPMRDTGSHEGFCGGVLAAANHARSFCKSVDVLTGSKQIRKVRMVEKTYLRKLAEVHYESEILSLKPREIEFDVVVVTDFGHSVPEIPRAEFLAVSVQTNSANIGFNLITKYEKADYIVIDEPEARLAAADRDGPIEGVIKKLADGRCNKFIVTHGPYGAYGYDGETFYRQKVFTDHVVDTMGAGDAFFAITAPMAKTGSIEDLLLIGTAAGGLKTQIVGHRESVTKEALIEFIRTHPQS